nr:BTAD domain-containing putative transcriptional regulator [Eggerthella lenta]
MRQAAASGAGEARSIELDRLGAFVRKEVSQASRGTLGLGDALAGIAYERACERGAIAVPALDAQAALAVRRIEMRLFSQRNACERLELERLERERVFVATHPDAYREEGRATRLPKLPSSVPALTVNLFGGLDVLMGDERVDPSLFSRQKVKTLLALLVLHNGREFSRDKLVGLLWPDSEIMHGRKNFYGIWAMLRRALTLPSGECPYLIRQQQGLRLDASLLTSDVAQLEDVCRTLLFERPGYGGWAQVYSQVNDRFSDDLLPSENGNDALASLRVDYRNRLVDALVAASTRLVAAGEAQEGLWFARAALQRDRSREDAYICLMQAQLAAGQRTAALETYFACRRFLTDELGIDPSLETMRLYRSIIETETDFE